MHGLLSDTFFWERLISVLIMDETQNGVIIYFICFLYSSVHFITFRHISIHFITFRYISIHFSTFRYILVIFITFCLNSVQNWINSLKGELIRHSLNEWYSWRLDEIYIPFVFSISHFSERRCVAGIFAELVETRKNDA